MKISASGLQHVLRIILACLIALVIYYHFDSPQNYWIIFSAFLLVQIRLGQNFLQQLLCLLLIGFVASCNAYLSGLIGENYYLLSVYLFATSFISVVIGMKYRKLFLSAYLINLFGMMSGGMAIEMSQVNERFYFVLLGMCIVILLNAVLWPRMRRLNFTAVVSECHNNILVLQKTFFEIYLKRDYQNKMYFYEKKIHQQLFQILHSLNQLRTLVKTAKENEILQNMLCMQESVLALGQLRYRIKDYATFQIFEREMKLLTQTTEKLSGIIEALEDLYHGTLQVVSADPLAFLCFIQALKDFDNENMKWKNAYTTY